ncbi:DUF2804 family protein [Desertihabitans brevis]|uniref:DUF2804 family protein n=1 Tax=Desertihabitans brevis TaxID=2268447 RepID=UPI0011BECF2D|nr:DUF2804 family protein [Desertihabitans brevis]
MSAPPPVAYRGDGTGRPAHLPLPPARAPMVRGLRLRKTWRYVGIWSPAVSVCAASVAVGPLRQEFWGVWHRAEGRMTEHTRLLAGRVDVSPGRVRVRDAARRAELDLVLEEDPRTAVEVVTPVGRAWTWTRKQVVRGHGSIRLDGRRLAVDGVALIDDNAGYHPRLTRWWWSGGTGRLTDGRLAAWSLIVGLNDTLPHIENTLWLDGVPQALGPVRFEPDLSAVHLAEGGTLRFSAEAERASTTDLFVVRSAYRQPFGTYTGTLPGGLQLTGGVGVMEDHTALW